MEPNEITVTEFRKNIKGYFDKALAREVVCIERGGVHYNLIARLPIETNPEIKKQQLNDFIRATKPSGPTTPEQIAEVRYEGGDWGA